MAWDISDYGNCYFKSLCKVLGSGEDLDEIFYQNAGAYAPWRSRGPGGGKKGLPRGCEINQVTLVSTAMICIFLSMSFGMDSFKDVMG